MRLPFLGAVTQFGLCSTMPKYERYREAWQLLREGSGCEEAHIFQNQGATPPQNAKTARSGDPEMGHPGETLSEPEKIPMGPGVARMQGAMNFFRSYLEKGGRVTR